jgi:hypothetical protein
MSPFVACSPSNASYRLVGYFDSMAASSSTLIARAARAVDR